MSKLYPYIVLSCYFAICVAAVIFMFKRRVARRKMQPIDEKLLRCPGEGVLEKMEKLDEQLIWFFFLAVFFPLSLINILLIGLMFLPAAWLLAGELFSAAAFIVAVYMGVSLVAQKMEEYRNWRLGYMGERFVAEQLDSLRECGCRIFHDVPRQEGSYQSNIDHVVVELFGVYAIETKTRRKNDRRKQPDAPPNVITFDGEKVSLPNWSGVGPLEQAKQNAFWLENFLHKKLHFEVRVMPILTFPFWSVEGGSLMPNKLHVCNPGQLRGLIPGNPIQKLSTSEFDDIVRVLDLLCRNVAI